MCKTLASQITMYSQGRISVISLWTNEAETLLKKFYPSGHPFNYFLIEEQRQGSKVWEGRAAALRLARHLPITASARVFATYLRYQAPRNQIVGVDKELRPQSLDSHQSTDRRQFLRAAFAGAAVLGLGWVLSGIPAFKNSGVGGLANKPPPVIKLDDSMLINGKPPKHIEVSPSGQVLKWDNEDPPTAQSSPDCACFPCVCCPPNGTCCRCTLYNGQLICYDCCCLCNSCNPAQCYSLGYGCETPGGCCYHWGDA